MVNNLLEMFAIGAQSQQASLFVYGNNLFDRSYINLNCTRVLIVLNVSGGIPTDKTFKYGCINTVDVGKCFFHCVF